jgi:F-type H+-transporting ATPase subunit delta
VIKGAVARRYAQAIFEIGEERETVERWLADVRQIAEYFGNRRLAFILNEPNISFARKRLVIQDLLGGKVQPDALGLALLLVERGLVDLAPRIRDEFERRYNDYHNQAVAEITTVIPLDDALRASVRADLQRITGKNIILKERVDPSIIGGAIARVGDTLLDGSIRRRLTLLKQQMERGGGSFGGPSDGATIPPDLGGSGSGGAPVAPPAPNGAGPSSGPSSQGTPGDGRSGGGGGTPPRNGGPAGSAQTAPRAQSGAHQAPNGRSGTNAPDRRARRGKGRR